MSYRYGAARVVGAYYFDGAGGAVPGVLSGSITLGSVVASGAFVGEISPAETWSINAANLWPLQFLRRDWPIEKDTA